MWLQNARQAAKMAETDAKFRAKCAEVMVKSEAFVTSEVAVGAQAAAKWETPVKLEAASGLRARKRPAVSEEAAAAKRRSGWPMLFM